MINNHKVIIAAQATNLIKYQYWPISKACVKSYCDIDYVDEIILYTCENEDNTVEEHSISEKVFFIKNKSWKGGDTSYDIWWKGNNNIFQLIADRAKNGEKIILITPSIEDFFTLSFAKQLHSGINLLISSDFDGFALPWKKCYSINMMESPGFRYREQMTGQSMQTGVFKYDYNKNSIWYGFNVFDGPLERIVDGIIGERNFNLALMNGFTEYAIQYDNWCFTKERMEIKIKEHCEWKQYNFKSLKEAYIKKYKSKFKSYNVSFFNKKDHPIEIQNLIDNYINKNHLGYEWFNFLKCKATDKRGKND